MTKEGSQVGSRAHAADLWTAVIGSAATGIFTAALPLTHSFWAVYAVTFFMALGAYSPGIF